jgi:hypothetical protein
MKRQTRVCRSLTDPIGLCVDVAAGDLAPKVKNDKSLRERIDEVIEQSTEGMEAFLLTPPEKTVLIMSWLGGIALAGLVILLAWEIIRST